MTGIHTRKISPIRQSLLDAMPVEPYQRKPDKIFRGPKGRLPAKQSEVSDEQVLYVRWLHDFKNMKPLEIASVTNLEHGTVKNLLKYTTRVHLTPVETSF